MTGYGVHTAGLSLSYGGDPALTGVDLDLAPGRIHGLLGRNGAGKTTLMSVLAALRRGTGTVRVDGQDPFENETVMEDVCLIRESGDTLTDEKLRTNLNFLQDARPFFDRAYAESLIAVFGLDLTKKPQHLSRGQASAFGAIVVSGSASAIIRANPASPTYTVTSCSLRRRRRYAPGSSRTCDRTLIARFPNGATPCITGCE